MIMSSLYHPPHIDIDYNKTKDNTLYLNHHFEGKPLVADFISNTMLGIEYLWGSKVQLETSEVVKAPSKPYRPPVPGLGGSRRTEIPRKPEIKWQRVLYTMENRKITKSVIRT